MNPAQPQRQLIPRLTTQPAQPQPQTQAQARLRGPRRFSRSQIEKRRVEVWEMHCCGVPVQEIAQRQNVSDDTIRRDITWWQNRLGAATLNLRNPEAAAADVGMTAAKLSKAAEDAYVEYLGSANASFKAKFLQVYVVALTQRTKILAEHGYLPRVGHETPPQESVRVTFEARFGAGSPQAVFDDPKASRRILDAAEALLRESARSGVSVPALLTDARATANGADGSSPTA